MYHWITNYKTFVCHFEISIVNKHLNYLCSCTWQLAQVQVHIVHMATNPSSSPYHAHGGQFEFKFTPMMKEIKKGLWYNVSWVKFNFVMFVLNDLHVYW